MSPSASFALRVDKCEKYEGQIEVLTPERTHMLDTDRGEVRILKRISSYILCEEITCLQGRLGHFG
jgi:hypothetical protein